MNFEKELKVEQIGRGREKLLDLEKAGKFVFHGSPDIVDILEPRQAYNRNDETGTMEKHDDPAVFATPYADVAIFRALVNAKGFKEGSRSSFGVKDGQLQFSATQNLLDQAKQKVGYVYILDKQKFNNFTGMQCQSKESIIPIQMFEVFAEDLPKDINLINPEHE